MISCIKINNKFRLGSYCLHIEVGRCTVHYLDSKYYMEFVKLMKLEINVMLCFLVP